VSPDGKAAATAVRKACRTAGDRLFRPNFLDKFGINVDRIDNEPNLYPVCRHVNG
jgi:hypothetical protein